MQRPTTRGINTRAVGLFNQAAPTRFVAVYDDETTGPERSTRERAENDYRDANATTGEIRAAIKDYKSHIDGQRLCLALDSKSGATCLTSWLGPKVLES